MSENGLLQCLEVYRRIEDKLGANYLALGKDLFVEFHRDYLRPLWGFQRDWSAIRLYNRLQDLLSLEADVDEAVDVGKQRMEEEEEKTG